MTELDLGQLASTLHDHGVRFVIIGGVAVGAHGHVRATEDLDIVPHPETENIERLSSALVALEATLPRAGGRRFQPARDEGSLQMGSSLTVQTRFGDLDVVQRIPGVPDWTTLESRAIETDLLGVPVRVCSLDDLRQMKRARASEQDRSDLAALGDT